MGEAIRVRLAVAALAASACVSQGRYDAVVKDAEQARADTQQAHADAQQAHADVQRAQDSDGRCTADLASAHAQVAARDAALEELKSRSAERDRTIAVTSSVVDGIHPISLTEFNIDRAIIAKILENQADLMRQARIVPEQQGGQIVGLRLFGVRPPLATLGLRNGDRLQRINGFELSSPEKALEAYAHVRTADLITLQINRAGKNVDLRYHIR